MVVQLDLQKPKPCYMEAMITCQITCGPGESISSVCQLLSMFLINVVKSFACQRRMCPAHSHHPLRCPVQHPNTDALISKVMTRMLLPLLGYSINETLGSILKLILDDLYSWYSIERSPVVTERTLLCFDQSGHIIEPSSFTSCSDPQLNYFRTDCASHKSKKVLGSKIRSWNVLYQPLEMVLLTTHLLLLS